MKYNEHALLRVHLMQNIKVWEKYNERTEKIGNPKAYLLTILYNAKEQMTLELNNRVQHDFYGKTDDTA